MKRLGLLVLVSFMGTVLAQPVKAVASELGGKMCSIGYADWSGSRPIKDFEKSILKHLGLPEDTANKEKIISKFFNENNHLLICDDDNDTYIRESEHILKRSLALGEYNFLNYAANNHKYELDWNFYEMVDGEKETLLDYLDMIINDEEIASEYDVDELKELVVVLEQAGGKRGRELE